MMKTPVMLCRFAQGTCRAFTAAKLSLQTTALCVRGCTMYAGSGHASSILSQCALHAGLAGAGQWQAAAAAVAGRPWDAAEDLVLATIAEAAVAAGRTPGTAWQAASDALAAGLAAASPPAAIAAFAHVRFLPWPPSRPRRSACGSCCPPHRRVCWFASLALLCWLCHIRSGTICAWF